MESSTFILFLAALASTAAVTSAYPVPYASFLPYTYSSFGVPRTLPLAPAYNYAFQATVPPTAPFAPLFSPAKPASAVGRVIYSEGALMTPSNVMLRGFAYQTRYTNGGHSEVTFVTGPGSKELMEQHLEFFRNLLLPAPAGANSSQAGNTSLPTYASVLNSAPLSNLDQSSAYRLLPAHTSPLLENPLELHNMINYFQTVGRSPFTHLMDTKEGGDDSAEGQESMISELGRILAPVFTSNAQGNSEESNSIDDVPASSSTPDTTQASTSESNSPSTEQVSTDNSVANSNVISSTQTQESETPTSEQTSSSTEQNSTSEQTSSSTEQASSSTEQASTSSTEDVPATTSEVSPSSEAETTIAAQSPSSEQIETTSTEVTAPETTTQDDDTDLAESA